MLFGRKINLAEDPLALVAPMKRVVDREIGPADAVRAYHDALAKAGVPPLRPLEDDLVISRTRCAEPSTSADGVGRSALWSAEHAPAGLVQRAYHGVRRRVDLAHEPLVEGVLGRLGLDQ